EARDGGRGRGGGVGEGQAEAARRRCPRVVQDHRLAGVPGLRLRTGRLGEPLGERARGERGGRGVARPGQGQVRRGGRGESRGQSGGAGGAVADDDRGGHEVVGPRGRRRGRGADRDGGGIVREAAALVEYAAEDRVGAGLAQGQALAAA